MFEWLYSFIICFSYLYVVMLMYTLITFAPLKGHDPYFRCTLWRCIRREPQPFALWIIIEDSFFVSSNWLTNKRLSIVPLKHCSGLMFDTQVGLVKHLLRLLYRFVAKVLGWSTEIGQERSTVPRLFDTDSLSLQLLTRISIRGS